MYLWQWVAFTLCPIDIGIRNRDYKDLLRTLKGTVSVPIKSLQAPAQDKPVQNYPDVIRHSPFSWSDPYTSLICSFFIFHMLASWHYKNNVVWDDPKKLHNTICKQFWKIPTCHHYGLLNPGKLLTWKTKIDTNAVFRQELEGRLSVCQNIGIEDAGKAFMSFITICFT